MKVGDLVRRNMEALRGGRYTSMPREALTHSDDGALAIVTKVAACNATGREEVWVQWLPADSDSKAYGYPGPIRADWMEVVS